MRGRCLIIRYQLGRLMPYHLATPALLEKKILLEFGVVEKGRRY
jgi:hypothetical protein